MNNTIHGGLRDAQSHLKRLDQLEITGAQIRDLLHAAAGVEHGCPQSVIAASLQPGPVDRFENRLNLLVFQVIDGPLSCALEGNAEDTLSQFETLWITRGYKMKERVNGREPDISRGDTISALLFKVGQEGEDSRWIKVSQVEPGDRLIPLSGKKAEQQNKTIAVAADGAWVPEGGEDGP